MPASPDNTAAPALRDLQVQFVREVLYRDSVGLLPQVLANGRSAEERVAVYRGNARENFALALEAAFPLLLACTGAGEFRQLAWSYQRACPSPAGNLFHVGERLPGYLAAHLAGTADEGLIDVARLEWAVQEALVAADSDATLDLSALAAVAADEQAGLRFHAHPSVCVLASRYAVFGAWEALQAGTLPATSPAGPPVAGPEQILVRRRVDGVELQRLSRVDLAFLEAVTAGATFAAVTAALPPAAQDELGALLLRWVTAGVITGFSADDATTGESPP